jgi:hypothetical protein
MNSQEKQSLREIVQKYKLLEAQLLEIEKIQEALKIKVKSIMDELEKNRETEARVLEDLSIKYEKTFTVNELMEIVNGNAEQSN